jgi:hypothetical protein
MRPRILALAAAAALLTAGAQVGAATDAPVPWQRMTPDQIYFKIRDVFRSHRPPPLYEQYTLVRQDDDAEGYPDYANSYTFHIWERSSDKAALGRQISYLGGTGQISWEGPPEFMRPQLNALDAPPGHPELADPGPPTADLFQPAPLVRHPITWVPTPEPTNGPQLPVIAREQIQFNLDYRVTSVGIKDGLLHVSLVARRDPQRNRLRELWAIPTTFDLTKVVEEDHFEVCYAGNVCKFYPAWFTITLSRVENVPAITQIRAVVQGGYNGDDRVVDYAFENVTFPDSLPAWYFDATQYAQHLGEAPT